MTKFYTVDISDERTLLLTENSIIVNAYIDSSDSYDLFSFTVASMATATNSDLIDLTITDGVKRIVDELLELENESAAIEHILKYGQRV